MAVGRTTRWLRFAGCEAKRAAGVAVVVAASTCAAGWASNDAVAAAAKDTATPVRSHSAKKVVALSPWEQAEQGRETLEAIPEQTRTRADYTRAMDAYRAIYHGNPADVHAAAAVNAVAELLAEQGRALGGSKSDVKSLQAAVGQYEFLRKQYPGSSLGVQALLAEGQIEQDDLGDPAAAQEKYKLLLKEYAKSEQAEEAKAGLASLAQGVREQGTVVSGQLTAGAKSGGSKGVTSGAAHEVARMDLDPTPPAKPAGIADRDVTAKGGTSWKANSIPAVGSQRSAVSGLSSLPPMAQTSGAVATSRAVVPEPNHPTPPAKLAGTPDREITAMNGTPELVASGGMRSGKRALVTGIRHWSTATYTRVAIDLGDNVTYEAARVPNPDRIYFDLHGTKLAQELVGKSFAVTDDGFLKKVRAAQYSDDVTRVVLDVNDVTEYSAFLLPNPYRLIIDIHGGKAQVAGNRDQETVSADALVVGEAAPAPRVAAVVKATAAKPVPNAVATRSASAASEVADLSEMPGRVEATSRPTSKPISAVVDETGSWGQGGNALPSTGGLGQAYPNLHESAVKSGAPDSVAPKTRKSKAKVDAASAPVSTTSTLGDATPARAAVHTADGETSLVRALGLKIGRIVIDAGHGGHDSGTLGVDGIQEKDVVLDVALRLGKLLHDRLGAEIIYTRSDDTFVPLETRTAIANKAQADLFLSIHANSSPDASARGVETYYLNFTSDPTALDVAARENAVSDHSIHQLSDLVKKIALKDKIAESREFAADVEESLYGGLQRGNAGLKDRGVKKAPFVVLIGANMPSILAEISFVTNPRDAEQLQDPEYRERVAESIYKGVARYEGGLSGTRVTTERAAVGQ
jgi:N-acetylmuramoyl-L-alanine amidase